MTAGKRKGHIENIPKGKIHLPVNGQTLHTAVLPLRDI